MQNAKPVLLVEDNIVNAMAVKRAFGNLKAPKSVVHLENGEEALKYLKDDSNRKPDLILLDINMPGMNGIDFLRIIKGNPILKSIPVVMLATSDDERDITDCFELNVVGYVIKPLDEELFVETIETVARYWCCSKLPNIKAPVERYDSSQNTAEAVSLQK